MTLNNRIYMTVVLLLVVLNNQAIRSAQMAFPGETQRGDENALVRPLPPFFAPGTKYQYWDEATQQYGYNNNDLFILPAWNMVIVRLGLDQQEDEITADEYNVFLTKVGEAILDPIVEGRHKAWHPLTVSFRGPTARETDDSPNPFLDYRLVVTFTGPGTREYHVPGFFAGDGHGGSAGNVWQVHFTPDAPGRWSFRASFRKGKNIAISLEPEAGEAAIPDAQTGAFNIAVADPHASGFLGKGRLTYAPDKFYLKTLGDDRYWIKGGTDSPEDFLAYDGFDDTRTGSGFAVKQYAAHVRDWKPGDPDWPNWNGGRGKAIIGAINYLVPWVVTPYRS